MGTACNIIGSTCKKHECNAGAQRSITKPLSEKEIADYAKEYAEQQVEKGFISEENVTKTIEIMKNALVENNKQFKQ